MNLDLVAVKVKTEYESILGSFSSIWTADLSALVVQVDRSCPSWEPHRQTLLSNPAVIKDLTDNKDYGKIGAVCGEIRNQVKLLKQVHADRKGSCGDRGQRETASFRKLLL